MKPGIDIMVSEENKPKKLYPWYVLVIADVLLTAVILCTFSYFHHVRMLWGLGPYKNNDDAAVYKITKPVVQTTEAVPVTEPVTTAEEITAPPTTASEQPSETEPTSEAVPQSTAPAAETEPPATTAPASTAVPAVTTAPPATEPPATATAPATQSTTAQTTAAATSAEPIAEYVAEDGEELDVSGDFGALFPAIFIQDSERVTLDSDEEIKAYAAENGIILREDPKSSYIALYRSHDIFLTVQEVNHGLDSWKVAYSVQYFVFDIYVRNIENLFAGYSSGMSYPAHTLIEKTEEKNGVSVIAAVNGDYVTNRNHCLLCERNGNILRDVPKRIESDICVLYYDGTMETITPDNYDWSYIEAKAPYQIWNFGPGLIDGSGKAIEKFDYNAYDSNIMDSTHPRTSIGYYSPGHYNFVVVDGRSNDSRGVKMAHLAEIQESLGCKAAYNMDGGDSSQAYFCDTVVRESARKDGQRKLPDLVCVGEVSE